MKLIWTYSKSWKKGFKNNHIDYGYVEYLYKKSLIEAGNQFKKIIYTDEESKDIFKDYVDEVKIIEPREFVFLADLKFYVLEKEQGEFCCIDGDLFLKRDLEIPPSDFGFELEFKDQYALEYSKIFVKHGIHNVIPYWGLNKLSINLGLMYFNNDEIKNELVLEFKKVQKFYLEKIEPIYNYNEHGKQVSVCGSQYFTSQFLEHRGIKPDFFNDGNEDFEKFFHIGGPKKMFYHREYIRTKKSAL